MQTSVKLEAQTLSRGYCISLHFYVLHKVNITLKHNKNMSNTLLVNIAFKDYINMLKINVYDRTYCKCLRKYKYRGQPRV